MKLYKFRQVDTYSLSGLSNSSLWFSDLKDFNDPFEGSYVLDEQLSEEVEQSLIARVVPKPDAEVDVAMRERMFREAGITDGGADKASFFRKMVKRDFEKALVGVVHRSKAICMSMENSEKEKDPLYENLMWSHYADGLRGFCMVFDSEKLQTDFYQQELTVRPIEVDYQVAPITLSLNDFARSRHILNEDPITDTINEITKTVGTKSIAWEYENEFRMLSLEDGNVHRYEPDSLIEIVIGDKMPKDQQKLVIDTALSANPDIKVKSARLKKNTYQLEIVDY
ncbi:hypothetical protein BCT19_01235 [Vibrio splendidus]|uniref:DUF2971 domain-containing protein n=1 Tax=Vibrio splendidus TaxID=29497 RepID=UPI000C850705|nr:DUF2971 domain-containing protein [Vibrio splendidus]PMO04335.1 hypothetical protein BCT19_01235 [Vibrio splendidus]